MKRQPFAMVPLSADRSTRKPRRKGLTMMMDWGLPVNQQRDYLDLVAPSVPARSDQDARSGPGGQLGQE